MSEASAILAVGQDFEYQGRKYHLRPFTLKDEAIYEAWLERQAYEAVMRQRPWMEDSDYKIALNAVVEKSASQEFNFMGRIAQTSLTTASGVKQFLLMTMEYVEKKESDPPIDEELIAKMYNDRLEQSIKYIEKINSDPKAKAEFRRQQKKARRSAKSR